MSTAYKFCGTTIGKPLGLTNGSMGGIGDMGGGSIPRSGSIVTGALSNNPISTSIGNSSLGVLFSNEVSPLNLEGVASFSS